MKVKLLNNLHWKLRTKRITQEEYDVELFQLSLQWANQLDEIYP